MPWSSSPFRAPWWESGASQGEAVVEPLVPGGGEGFNDAWWFQHLQMLMFFGRTKIKRDDSMMIPTTFQRG